MHNDTQQMPRTRVRHTRKRSLPVSRREARTSQLAVLVVLLGLLAAVVVWSRYQAATVDPYDPASSEVQEQDQIEAAPGDSITDVARQRRDMRRKLYQYRTSQPAADVAGPEAAETQIAEPGALAPE